MVLKQVSDTKALGREQDAATLQLATGMLAEAWLDPLPLTASTWLDPFNLKPSTRQGSVVIGTQPFTSRIAGSSARYVRAGDDTSFCVLGSAANATFRAKDSSPVRMHTYRVSPSSPTRNKSDRHTPVTSRDSISTRTKAWIASPQYRWMATLVFLAILSVGLYVILPAGASARLWPRLLFGLAGTGLLLFCAFLPVRKKLLRLPRCAKWRILRTSVWEAGHSYLGLLSCLVLHFHADFRIGGPLTAVLLGVLWAVLGTGLVELLFRRLLVLTKAGKEGKGLLAAQIIATTHAFAQEMHGPLTGTLLTLGAVHAVMALFY